MHQAASPIVAKPTNPAADELLHSRFGANVTSYSLQSRLTPLNEVREGSQVPGRSDSLSHSPELHKTHSFTMKELEILLSPENQPGEIMVLAPGRTTEGSVADAIAAAKIYNVPVAVKSDDFFLLVPKGGMPLTTALALLQDERGNRS